MKRRSAAPLKCAFACQGEGRSSSPFQQYGYFIILLKNIDILLSRSIIVIDFGVVRQS